MNVEAKIEAESAHEARMSLLPTHPGSWAEYPLERLFQLGVKELEPLQLAALKHRFGQLRDKIPALERLASRQGVTEIDSIDDALPVFFDHLVYKSYPLSLIETRDFKKLTAWLDRLTLHDLTRMDLTGLKTLDDWFERLDEFGMLVSHSTGTSGKLSFNPRSRVEWPAWHSSYSEMTRVLTGIDPRTEFIPTFFPGYRGGFQGMMRMQQLFIKPSAGSEEEYHTLYQTPLSADLISLAARLQSAEDKEELRRIGLDPGLLDKRDAMIAQAKRRNEDLEAWFSKLISDYRGRKVRIAGSGADLLHVTLAGKAKGLKCEFAPGTVVMSGGGLKSAQNVPPDWEQQVMDFFGVDKLARVYGMSESMGSAPDCAHGFYHIRPMTLPILLDEEYRALPREGVQTGRFAFFDLLAETYWGGFITADKVTMHWDDDCACGWKGPRVGMDISRMANPDGDDKISCAGSTDAYNEFLEFVVGG